MELQRGDSRSLPRPSLNFVSKRIKHDPPLGRFAIRSRGGMRLESEPKTEDSPSSVPSIRPPPSLESPWRKLAAIGVVVVAITSALVFVSRTPNQAPTIDHANVSSEFADTAQSLNLTAQARDADGDPMANAWNFGEN